jgi:nucleotidyltransferase substrate binding protein (TIGR01987 family)
MSNIDIRWLQRFSNFEKALSNLERYLATEDALNELEEQGLIQSFEYTYELAWNTLRDFYLDQGEDTIQGSRDAIQIAFKRGLIVDGEVWMSMLKDRNKSSHTYNKQTADEIVNNIQTKYFHAFKELKLALEKNKK